MSAAWRQHLGIDQNAKPGETTDETGKSIARAKPVAEYMLHILENGGIKPLLQKQLQ
ncbi:MAG: hypothetical protein LBV65_02945 [Desulfovibrio sp.]|jgi:hypothetical protein|nr:hypothetical protein [Desulfovibrio sp.]